MQMEVFMSIWERFAGFINEVATGDKKDRIAGTPVGFLIFFSLLILFILAGTWVDGWLDIPRITEPWRFIVSAVLFIGGFFFAGWTLAQFVRAGGTPVPINPPPKLITTGLYSHVRNPMLLGAFLLLEGLAFLIGSLSDIIVFAPLPVILYVIFIKYVEERELEMRFGQEYRDYKKRVPMFFPRLKK